MKNKLLLLLVSLFCVFQSNGQDLLKEITKTFENGKPMFIDYLEMEDLKKVKTEIFNESGTLIFSVQFNKDTGKYDGEFYDLINKGYFKDGILNCNNCMLVDANKPSVYTYNYDRQNTLVTKGNVVNGRLTGKVERYTLREETYRKVDWESTRKYVDAGAGLGFRDVKTYTTGQFIKTQLPTFNYNSNGVLNGEQIFKYKNGEVRRLKLNFENGIVTSKVSYDSNNLIIDSLFNENKIWKINKKFVKNDGFLMFSRLQENWTGDYSIEYHKSGFYNNPGNPQQDGQPWEKLFLLGGGYQKIGSGGNERPYNTGGVPSGLDDNGLFTRHETLSIGDVFDEVLFSKIYNYLINFDMELFKGLNDAAILGWNDRYGGGAFSGFDPFILTNEFLDNGLTNPFNSFIKEKKLWEEKDINFNNRLGYNNGKRMLTFSSPSDFFINFISLKDFLISSKELIENNIVEIQKIYVWDSVLKKYALFDFDKLIDLSDESRIKKVKSDYTTNYKNRIASIFEIDIKELEQYKNSYPYELLNSNKYDSRKWKVKDASDDNLINEFSIKRALAPSVYSPGSGPFAYGVTSAIGLRNVDRFPCVIDCRPTLQTNISIDYIWILDFKNEGSLFKFIENKELLLKLNERNSIYASDNSYNPDLHTPDLVYIDVSKNRIGLKPTIGNWDVKNQRWYSVLNTNEKLSPQESYEEMKKRFQEKMELFEKKAVYNSAETNEKIREELETDYKKLQNAQKKTTQDSSNENVTSNSDTTNTDLIPDNNTNERITKPIENLELWYSSEKSSDFYLKQISRQLKDLNSYYSLNLLKIEIHRVPGNKDATEAFTFYYFKDLNGLKTLEQLSSENKSVNLYHKDENNLLLVYNAKK
jgi:hypothetical protein